MEKKLIKNKCKGTSVGYDVGSAGSAGTLIDFDNHKFLAGEVYIHGDIDNNQERGKLRRQRRGYRRNGKQRELLRKCFAQFGCKLEGLSDVNLLRKKGLDEELTLKEFGLVCLKLSNSKGFLSNGIEYKDSSSFYNKITLLEEEIEKSGCRTLGEYICSIKCESFRGNLFSNRALIANEFDLIVKKQKELNPNVFSDKFLYGNRGKQKYPTIPKALKSKDIIEEFGVHGIIFYQRQYYWDKSTIGRCSLIPSQYRCSSFERNAEKFRILQNIINLRIISPVNRDLTKKERDSLVNALYKKEKLNRKTILEVLKLDKDYQFNIEEDVFGIGIRVDGLIRKKYYNWDNLDEQQKNNIVNFLINDRNRFVYSKFDLLSNKDKDILLSIDFPESNRMSYSLKAINKLLPHLSKYKTLEQAKKFIFIRPKKQIYKSKIKINYNSNPQINKILSTGCKTLNRLISIKEPDIISIESTRSLKLSGKKLKKYNKNQNLNKNRNKEAVQYLTKIGKNISKKNILMYKKWLDQDGCCFSSGENIPLNRLFNGDYNLDHLQPKSISCDNSYSNLVLVKVNENSEKGNRTYIQWLGKDSEKYKKIVARGIKIGDQKLMENITKEICDDSFVKRQLQDTSYASCQLRDMIIASGRKTNFVRPLLVSALRKMWKLDDLIYGNKEDNRDNYWHHLIDATVIACLSSYNENDIKYILNYEDVSIEMPWPNFREDLRKLLFNTVVKHRVIKRRRGELHDQIIYSKSEKKGYVGKRIKIEELKISHIKQIKNKYIREQFQEHLNKFNIKGEIPSGFFKEHPIKIYKTTPKRVKIEKEMKSNFSIDRGQVKPNNNFCFTIFKDLNNKYDYYRYTLYDIQSKGYSEDIHPTNPQLIVFAKLHKGSQWQLNINGKIDNYVFATANGNNGVLTFYLHNYGGKRNSESGVNLSYEKFITCLI